MENEKLLCEEMFLLFNNGNPSSALAVVFDRPGGGAFLYGPEAREYRFVMPLWAAELIVNNLPFTYLCEDWAAIEDLNTGSYQRCQRLRQYQDLVIKGSGRWLSRDEGGHFSALKKVLNQWSDLDDDQKRKWQRVAKVLDLTRKELLKWVESEKTRRFLPRGAVLTRNGIRWNRIFYHFGEPMDFSDFSDEEFEEFDKALAISGLNLTSCARPDCDDQSDHERFPDCEGCPNHFGRNKFALKPESDSK